MLKKNTQKNNSGSGDLALVDHRFSEKKGFSLIEVLFTTLVLSIGITSIASLMTANIKSYANSRDQIIASMLAQEGVELVRNLKDNDELEDDPSVCTFSGNDECDNLIVEATDNQNIENGANDNKIRLYRDESGFFAHLPPGVGTETNFYRKLFFDISGAVANSDRTITVTSYVTWNSEGFTGNISDVVTNPDNCNIANKCVQVISVMPDMD